ncbi:MAG: phosphoglycolate phosphatase [Aquabacterium sp.]
MTATPRADGPALPVLGGIRAAIVDLDGTMVDTIGDFEAALAATLAELQLPRIDRAFIERTVGKGSEHLIRQVLAHVGAQASWFDDAMAAYQRHYAACNGQHSQVYPGVVAGLQRMRSAGWALACLTNKPGRFARALLQIKGLDGHFAVVNGGDAFERKKPDPLPLLRTCDQLGLPPAAVLMVGDSANDVQAARAAGCPVVLVGYGYNHGQPAEAAGADAVVARLDQLLPG